MNNQLLLFDLPAKELPKLSPAKQPQKKQATPALKTVQKGGLLIEPNGQYWSVFHVGTGKWVGSIYHLGSKVYNLYLPDERGICDFGGPDLIGAAERVYACWLKKRKEAGRG